MFVFKPLNFSEAAALCGVLCCPLLVVLDAQALAQQADLTPHAGHGAFYLPDLPLQAVDGDTLCLLPGFQLLLQLPVAVVSLMVLLRKYTATAHRAGLALVFTELCMRLQFPAPHLGPAALLGTGHHLKQALGAVKVLLSEGEGGWAAKGCISALEGRGGEFGNVPQMSHLTKGHCSFYMETKGGKADFLWSE